MMFASVAYVGLALWLADHGIGPESIGLINALPPSSSSSSASWSVASRTAPRTGGAPLGSLALHSDLHRRRAPRRVAG
ncbi:MAG: hypothetical protein WAV18_29540, partial [Roseiarcus sp.]